MKITQLRNATMIVEIADYVILVDPMLAPKAAIPSLKYLTNNRRRNPLVALPQNTDQLMKKVTHCLITHCQKGHFDHLDRAGAKWLRENKIPTFCAENDVEFLQKKGLNIQALNPNEKNSFLGGSVNLIPCVHGEGLVGKFMAHGYGYFIQLPGEPSLYITGDTVLTNDVRNAIKNNEPDVIVLPAGGAQFDIGGDIIMGLEEAIQVGELTKGWVIANHLEALDHCPVTREQLQEESVARKLNHRFLIPQDGETLTGFEAR